MTTANFETLFGDSNPNKDHPTDGAPKVHRPRGRPPKSAIPIPSKSTIVDAIAFANMAVAVYPPTNKYQLSHAEIDSLADAWYAVIKEHPSVGKYLVIGKKLGIWGNLIFVHYSILASRMPVNAGSVPQTQARPARTNGGSDGFRKDDTSPISTLIP